MARISRLFPQVLLIFALAACSYRESGGPNSGGQARVELHKQGVIIEAKYNPDLDNLIPGYKIVTVALTNHGFDLLKLNPLRDRWEIVDALGQNRRASNGLRIKDPKAWSRLPPQVKELIEYPVGVTVGYSETIDLFFPNNIDLTAFRAISFYSAERKEKYDILAIDQPEKEPPQLSAEVPPVKSKPRRRR
ncbi:MAG TPA: hypothetical protein DF383_11470 [Deltaproteobacteria bacterium]|nr:hypothetical protein [Deltaproteobacteria bacterium]